MRKLLAAVLFSSAVAVGCGGNLNHIKVDQVALGRVVVYRNGVAYYERRAEVTGGKLTVTVPRDKVDDFLKSLTVVDAKTQTPLPVSFPRQQADYGAFLEMTLELPTKQPADVVLTYVTESPAWKPTYRIVVNDGGKVMIEGWAVVDNTSGEDWKGVLVGVGSSSALSFRYDLWSVRSVARETLAADAQFAVAPPTGVSPYAQQNADASGVVAELDDSEIRKPVGHPEEREATRRVGEAPPRPEPPMPAPPPARYGGGAGGDAVALGGVAASESGGWDEDDAPESDAEEKPMRKRKRGGGGGGRTRGANVARRPPPPTVATVPAKPAPPANYASGDQKLRATVDNAKKTGNIIVIEGYADANVAGAEQRANDRANIVKNQLIDAGVPPGQFKVVTKVAPGERDRVRLGQEAQKHTEVAAAQGQGNTAAMMEDGPVGESHFQSKLPMTVTKGTSAMVSMVRDETPGEIVYLYDAESERGNDRFAFRAVRLINPTDSTLETGPVTVYGNKRFIGEGLTEPIPPRAPAVVPFALDRQIVVERETNDDNRIHKLITLQRGILTAEVQHIKRTRLKLTSRLHAPTTVFIRHTIGKGWKMIEAPKSSERIGDAHLFKVALGAGETTVVELAEATPLTRTLDLNAEVTLDMMKIYVEAPEASHELKDALKELLKVHRELVDSAEKINSIRRKLVDYRQRMDELHAQLLTLQAVKTGGDLMRHLRAKMKDISDRVQKSTIELVDVEEKVMLARVRFQDQLAELKLGDVTAAPVAKKK
jgi:hypothetical protein